MFMDEIKFASNGDEMAVQFSQLSCSTGQQTDHHNWESNLMGENYVAETSSTNAVDSTNGIVVEDHFPALTELGGLCNSTNFTLQSQMLMGRSKSFNMASSYNANLPGSGRPIQSFPNSETFMDYAALNEKAGRLLSPGSKSFSGRSSNLEVNESKEGSGKRSRVADNQVLSSSALETAEFTNPSRFIGDENNAVKPNENKCFERQTNCNSRPREPPKDYIHVRARRGQATDSHSLAERVRREKISKRMKLLQDLVPGCHKVTGKAVMLDEIINYVQSLQQQVQFLSMKLATVDPRLDFYTGVLPSKNMLHMVSPSDSSVLDVEQEPVIQRSFSNGMENQTSKHHSFNNYSQIQTVRDGDLQSLVQEHLGQLQIQELEFPCQSSHGSPPT